MSSRFFPHGDKPLTFAQVIETGLRSGGFTAKDVAREFGVPLATVERWAKGENEPAAALVATLRAWAVLQIWKAGRGPYNT